MTKRIFMTALLGMLLASQPLNAEPPRAIAADASSSASSQPLSAPLCGQAIETQLTMQQEILRQVWFGQKKAGDEAVDAVRRDEDGVQWLKVSDNTWRTAAPTHADETRTDGEMDAVTIWPGMNDPQSTDPRASRPGIFEQQGMFTSQFALPLAVSMRAFDCRLAMVCEGVVQSFLRTKTDAKGLLHITTPGCDDLTMKPIPECRFGNTDPSESADQRTTIAGFAQNLIDTECAPLASQLEDREAAFLRIAVAYDAAQRSLLQLGGIERSFVEGLKGNFLEPVAQTLPLLSAFSRLPCFPGQCNE